MTVNTAKSALILLTFKFQKTKTMARVGRLVIVPTDHIKEVNHMNKQELVKSVYDKLEVLPVKQCENAVNAVLDSIKGELAKGGEINLVGFGSFAVKTHQARIARNPKTGEKVQVPAKKVPSFKAGKGLKEAVN